jgi:hypothetical protein
LRWSFLTLTRLPICASSGLTKISLPLLTCISLKPGPSAGTFSDPRHRMLPNNFFPYLKHPHLTNAPHFVSKYTKCRRSSPEPYFLPLFTGMRGIGILRTSHSGHSRKLNFALTEFFEVSHRASGSGIMVVVERVKASYATSGLEKGENDA